VSEISSPSFTLNPSPPFGLSLWFDKLTMIGNPLPFALSLSKGILTGRK
jgi:hypothetical protein